MKKEIFVIEDEGKQTYCIYETTAQAEAETRLKNYLTTKVNERVFENMLNDNAFIDSTQYLESIKKPAQKENNNLPENTDMQLLLKTVTEMRELLDKLQSENELLKKRPRLSLEKAKELHDQKIILSTNKDKFDKAKENINFALQEMENVLEFDENNTFKLILLVHDHKANKSGQLFSITTNAVIQTTMKFVKNEILNKVADLEFKISEIENTFV